jgi:hypothetical protein
LGTILLPAFLSMTSLQAQTFDKDGHFQGQKDHLRYPSDQTVSHDPNTIDAKEIVVIKVRLSLLVQEAWINSQDEGIKNQYIAIWGEDFYRQYTAELQSLLTYLKNDIDDGRNYRWVPSPADLKKEIFDKPSLVEQAGTSMVPGVIRWWSVKKDNYNLFLLNRLKDNLKPDPVARLKMDVQYLNEWRKLEGWYESSQQELRAIKSMDSVLIFDWYKVKQYENNQNRRILNDVGLVNTIQNSLFIRKWLWYTGGVITLNPFGAAKLQLAYPAAEKNSFQTARLASVQDSLNKSARLKEITRNGVIHNDVQLIIEDLADSKKTNNNKWLIEYDAASSFAQTNKVKIDILEKQTYQIAVYNIDKNQAVSIVPTLKDLKDESRSITALNELADQIGVITKFTKPNLALFSSLQDRINPTSIPKIADNYNPKKAISNYQKKVQVNGFAFETLVKAGDVTVPLTKTDLLEDKRRLLGAYYRPANIEERNGFEMLLPKFLIDDQYFYLDYTSNETLSVTISELIKRFDQYTTKIIKAQKEAERVSDLVKAKNDALEPYIAIYSRSLPTGDLKDYLDTDSPPAYYTKIHTPTFDAPKTLTYVITTTPASGKDPVEVVKKSTKLVKSHRLDFSVGLAYTFCEYDIVNQSGKNMPTVDVGDRFNFIAGIHVYFKKLNKIDDDWWKMSGRWSLYAGLSITNVFDNFYTGISYDPTPGIRVIAGGHFYKDYRFKIINDQIAEKATGIKLAGPFLSLSMEPVTILKAIGLFN